MSEDILRLKKLDIIYSEGDVAKYIYIIKSGLVKTFKINKAKLETVSTYKEQDIFGELEMFTNNSRNETAIAFDFTELIKININDINEYLKLSPDWISNVLKTIVGRVEETHKLMVEHKIINQQKMGDSFLTRDEEDAIYRKISKN